MSKDPPTIVASPVFSAPLHNWFESDVWFSPARSSSLCCITACPSSGKNNCWHCIALRPLSGALLNISVFKNWTPFNFYFDTYVYYSYYLSEIDWLSWVFVDKLYVYFLQDCMTTINEKCRESGCFLTPVYVDSQLLTKDSIQVRFCVCVEGHVHTVLPS